MAYIIDAITMFIIVAISILVGVALTALHVPQSIAAVPYYIAAILAGIFYVPAFESSPYQGTPGKILMGVKVAGLDGKRISFLRALGRYFARFISALVFCLGFLMIAFNEKKQGLHDILAGTLVVDK